jgi:hypothetical protein
VRGKKYWIQNHVNCLSDVNEWAFDAVLKKLYVYSTSEPVNVFATYGDDSIHIKDSYYIEIYNINISGSQRTAITIEDSNYVLLDNVIAEWSGIYCFFASGVKNLKIIDCEGYDQNNDFIHAVDCVNFYVDGCKGLRCGVDPSSNRYLAVKSRGGNGSDNGKYVY